MSSRTASPRTPRSARVSAGICWARRVSRKLAHAGVAALLLGPGGGLEERADASRSRCASRAAWPPTGRRRGAAGAGQSVPDHSAQSTSSAVPPVGERVARPARSSAASARGPRGRRARRARRGSRRVEHAPARSSSRRRARRPSLGRAARVLLAGAQRPARGGAGRRRRARRAGEQQRLGPVGVDVVGVGRGRRSSRSTTAAQRVEQRQHRRARGPAGSSSPATSTGTPAAPRARRSRGIEARPGADQHRHLGPARRRPRGGRGAAGRRGARPRRARCRR